MGRISEEVSNIINFPGNDYPTRAEILNILVRTKRSARLGLQAMDKCFDMRRKARRQKFLLEDEANPFDNHRLGFLHDVIYAYDTHVAELQSGMAQLGDLLMKLSPFADQVLTFEEKAYVLGTTPDRLKKKVAHYSHLGEAVPGFVDLCFTYAGELKSNLDSVDFFNHREEDMPLREAVCQCLMRKFKEDGEFAKAASGFWEEMGMMFHSGETRPDGTTRLTPRLRVIRKPKKNHDDRA